jgi:hypothetical protein
VFLVPYLFCAAYHKLTHPVFQVDWQAADALRPDSYAHLLPGVNGVVHTLGTLLEDGKYKEKIKDGDLLGLVGSFVGGLVESRGNPLESGQERTGSYEVMNRNAGEYY